MAWLLLPCTLLAQESVELRVKAAYLFNFAKFVEWPKTAFADENSAIVIGVAGENPFGTTLEDTVAGKRIGGRELQVRQVSSPGAARGCHMLFIADSERARLAQWLNAANGLPILTVGDWEGFAAGGGMIRFYRKDKTIRFRINLTRAEQAHLKISSKLLQVATVQR